MKIRITEERLRQIITEELSSLKEDVDHEGVKQVVNGASKLLKACQAFQENPTPAMTNATTPHLSNLVQALEAMLNNPVSYTVQKPKARRVVKLRSKA